MNCIKHLLTGFPLCVIWLVRDDKQKITRIHQQLQSRNYVRQQVELLRNEGRFISGSFRTPDITVQHPVTVKKDGAVHTEIAVDSHFISFSLSLGWETMRCHTTACNASAMGVIISSRLVGTITQRSAT